MTSLREVSQLCYNVAMEAIIEQQWIQQQQEQQQQQQQKEQRRHEQAAECETRADPLSPQSDQSSSTALVDTLPAATRFVVVLQSVQHCMLFVRFDGGNEEFCSQLLSTLRRPDHVNHYTLAPRFFTVADARALRNRVAPSLGLRAHVFCTAPLRWHADEWQRARHNALHFVQAAERGFPAASGAERSERRPPPSLYVADIGSNPVAATCERVAVQREQAIAGDMERSFQRFYVWSGSIDFEFQQQLFPRLLLLTFRHCFYDLVLREVSPALCKHFVQRFEHLFAGQQAHVDLLRRMVHTCTPQLMQSDADCQHLRITLERDETKPIGDSNRVVAMPRRIVFYVTPMCYQFLFHNLAIALPPTIALIMRTYFDFQLRSQETDGALYAIL